MEKKNVINAILCAAIGTLLFIVYFNVISAGETFLGILGLFGGVSFIVVSFDPLTRMSDDAKRVAPLIAISIFSFMLGVISVASFVKLLDLSGITTFVYVVAAMSSLFYLLLGIFLFVASVTKKEGLVNFSIILSGLFIAVLLLDVFYSNGIFLSLTTLPLVKLVPYSICIYLLIDGLIGLKDISY